MFFSSKLQDFESLEGLNNSSAQSTGELWPLAKNNQRYLLWDFNVHPIFGFWAMISAPDMLETRSRALKTWLIA